MHNAVYVIVIIVIIILLSYIVQFKVKNNYDNWNRK